MRKFLLFPFLLAGCSTLTTSPDFQRNIAHVQSTSKNKIQASLSSEVIFANGVNKVFLTVSIKNENASLPEVLPADLKLITDVPVKTGKFVFSKGVFVTSLQPYVKSPDIKMYVQWKDSVSEMIVLKTTLSPLKDQLKPLPSAPTLMQYLEGLSYSRQDNFTEGLLEGFSVENLGQNRIVPVKESRRSFEFEFPEHATQNISLMVTDAPNSTVSHSMHSHFIFFPRKYLPYAEIKKKEVTVTLPTGEKMIFSPTGEIIGGVFTEGPVDTGPDRFTRTYANLKYQGKGILLRANARGQMPQQGQFESTKIDMDYGIKYSADVLIINGTTGQRCRRPKLDFWSNADVSPIQFKFPTDKEFDAYLRAKCNFGIPELAEENSEEEIQVDQLVEDVWSKCEDESNMLSCLEDETSYIENVFTRAQVKFQVEARYQKAKSVESEQLNGIVNLEIGKIRDALMKNADWIKDASDQGIKKNCLDISRTLITTKLRFHDIQQVMASALEQNCSTIKEEMIQRASGDVAPVKDKLLKDFSWATLESTEKLHANCEARALTFVDSEFRYHKAPSLYTTHLKKICQDVEKSGEFQSWLSTQGEGLEEKLFTQLLMEIEKDAESRANRCLNEFPMDTQINRIRFKKQRESCLIDHWEVIEQFAFDKVRKDPLVIRLNFSLEGLKERILAERRRLQLKVIKKYFQ